jgi:hypothetical protein
MHWVLKNKKWFSQRIVTTRFKSDRRHHLLQFPIHTYRQLSLSTSVSQAFRSPAYCWPTCVPGSILAVDSATAYPITLICRLRAPLPLLCSPAVQNRLCPAAAAVSWKAFHAFSVGLVANQEPFLSSDTQPVRQPWQPQTWTPKFKYRLTVTARIQTSLSENLLKC